MTEEIKEILDKLKDCVNNPIDIEVDQFTQEAYHIPNYFCLDATTNDCKSLLNYITNLQKENEDYKQRNEKAVEYIKNNLTISSILDGKTSYCLNNYSFDYEELLNILEGGDEN